MIRALKSRWRNFFFKTKGATIDGYCWIQDIEIPHDFDSIQLGQGCALDRGIVLLCSGDNTGEKKLMIGARTYINRNTFLDAAKLLKIGQDCGVGPGCYITDHDHGLNPNLTPLEQELICKPTVIGDRVWIGANVTILKGITIGDGAVIGAGSVVTKDIPAQAIAVGNPAKVIRMKGEAEVS
ncbi:acyltransferase [[Leptolyngbya] sp. PCC 7376]|uniref:acyltransferase n=1 Tax=[Leptolyngbya] sp. PCC 7376 TaxID=111781 RepID=UPI001CECB03F|nr:acyltransferase [[Leptolyngbya] sp. PCC 7376]